ncbi:MAG: rhodanese-like domain-containing protein [Chitinophagales bacterium]
MSFLKNIYNTLFNRKQSKMPDITVQELKKRLDAGEDILVIDVRQPAEYEIYNIGAKLIPLGELPRHFDDLSDYKDKEIVVHCRSGARSASAKQMLLAQGFESPRNLLGGMMEWSATFDK